MIKLILEIGITVSMIRGTPLIAQSNYKLANKIHVGGDGGWDYLNVDEVNGRIFVSHGTIAQAIDIKSGKLAGTIPDTEGIHGIAFASDLNKGFTSNGRDSSLTVFNLKTLEVIKKSEYPDKTLMPSYMTAFQNEYLRVMEEAPAFR